MKLTLDIIRIEWLFACGVIGIFIDDANGSWYDRGGWTLETIGM